MTGFDRLPLAGRFATKVEWERLVLPQVRRKMHQETIVMAMIAIADDDGLITNWDPPSFYETTLAQVFDPHGDTRFSWDAFAAMALTDFELDLAQRGLLSSRNNDDNTQDLRLTLPRVSPACLELFGYPPEQQRQPRSVNGTSP